MFGMWDVSDVGCSRYVIFGCGMFGMWDVGCEIFAGRWDIILQNASLDYTLLCNFISNN